MQLILGDTNAADLSATNVADLSATNVADFDAYEVVVRVLPGTNNGRVPNLHQVKLLIKEKSCADFMSTTVLTS